MAKPKCFQIDEGGERFWYAAETAEQALEAYKEDIADTFEGAEVCELSDEQMSLLTVMLETYDGKFDVEVPMKTSFELTCRGWDGSPLQLCSTIF